MKSYFSFAEINAKYSSTVSEILTLLVSSKSDTAFIYQNCGEFGLRQSAYLGLPKLLIKELEIRHTSKDFHENLDNAHIQIVQQINAKPAGNDFEFSALDTLHDSCKDRLYSNSEPRGPLYAIYSTGVGRAPKRLTEDDNPLKWVWLSINGQYANALLKSVITISQQDISSDKIFIKSDGEVFKLLSRKGDEIVSFEMDLCNELRHTLLTLGGCDPKDYPEEAETILRKKFPTIPNDALARIIDVSKPNSCKKTCWWEKK